MCLDKLVGTDLPDIPTDQHEKCAVTITCSKRVDLKF